MVMDVAKGSPAEKAGVLAGDILLAVGGALATRPGKIARQLGPGSIGQTLELKLARAGAILTSKAIVEARAAR
jgi:S1-C subfamily serine protease